MVKSASAGVGDAVQLQEQLVGLLVGGGQVGRRAGLHGDGADRVRESSRRRSARRRGDRDDDQVVGVASMLDEESTTRSS